MATATTLYNPSHFVRNLSPFEHYVFPAIQCSALSLQALWPDPDSQSFEKTSSASSDPPSYSFSPSVSSETSWTSSSPPTTSVAGSTDSDPKSTEGEDPLQVLPSQALKSPSIRKATLRKFQHPLIDEQTHSFDVEAVKARCLVSLARARRFKSAALETVAITNLQENLLLKRQAHLSPDFLHLQPQAAVDLARAARDSLLAAERLALTRVLEAEEHLLTLKDCLELAHVHVVEAELQVKKVVSAVQDRGIPIEPTPDLTSGLPIPLPFTVPLSQCDLPGAHSDDGPEERDFDIEFDETCLGTGSEIVEEDVVWEPDVDALE